MSPAVLTVITAATPTPEVMAFYLGLAVVIGIVLVKIVSAVCYAARFRRCRHHRGLSRRVEDVEQLARALTDHSHALQARYVQVEAARAQFVILCDQARDHLAVLAAVRDPHQDGRHGVDTATTALPTTRGAR